MRAVRLTRRQKKLVVLVAALVLAALGISTRGLFRADAPPRRAQNDPVPFASGARARVLHVIDGDTFDAELPLPGGGSVRERIRLLRINTPERDRRGYDEATRELVRLIGGKTVVLESEDGARFQRGTYGRVLAYVRADGVHVNAALVRAGWTTFYTKFGQGRFAAEFRAAEEEARENRRGLWNR